MNKTDYNARARRGVPRWVLITAAIAAVAVAALIVMMLFGGGHSPRRHGGDAPAAVSTVHTPPAGAHP